MLNSVEEIVEGVGGDPIAAALADVGGPAVSNWKARGRIPTELYFVFSEVLRRAGKEANPDVFGFKPAVVVGSP
jgi:hypothetical protein